MIRATLWDFGGVILSSPFDAFSRYEQHHGLPVGFIRGLNAANPDINAWAHLERGDISFDDFCDRFESEARDAGGRVDARQVMALLSGEVRPEMVEALRRCHERLKTGLLTNNFVGEAPRLDISAIFAMFDVVIESSQAGVRKPDPRFYQMTCDALRIDPSEAVFLDDLGINLKPAREMGMTTIKVRDPGQALTELEDVVGFGLR
ncbi:MAG TPA: HAD-IA family hydrolase [Acidimicrobiales bacterium]|nr:HAD-IA family hydrolase [Acidimicrobiales bacterium]